MREHSARQRDITQKKKEKEKEEKDEEAAAVVQGGEGGKSKNDGGMNYYYTHADVLIFSDAAPQNPPCNRIYIYIYRSTSTFFHIYHVG